MTGGTIEVMIEPKPRIKLEVRLKAEEKAHLWAVAKKRGVKVSQLVRDLIAGVDK
jgi:hypothetical protein